MAGGPEDQRNAATINASLSSYVMTASLGVIAAQAALATVLLDKRDHLTGFYVCMILGLVSSVFSIVLGGKGIAGIASGGFEGNWSLKKSASLFNRQAVACLFGMLLLLASVFTGRPKREESGADQIQLLKATAEQQQIKLDDLKAKCAAVASQLNHSLKPALTRHRAKKLHQKLID